MSRLEALRFLHAAARFAIAIGAVGSVGLMLYAGRATPKPLLVIFVFWVLSPFAALAWADVASARWTKLTRVTLYVVAVALAPVSMAVYAKIIAPPAGKPNAFVYVAMPPVSWLVIVLLVALAALISRRGVDAAS